MTNIDKMKPSPSQAKKLNKNTVPQSRAGKQNVSSKSTKTRTTSKSDRIISLLRKPGGASIKELSRATAWQAHSVRGFLSGTVKKKLGLNLTSATDEDKIRRYHIIDQDAG